MKVCSLHPRVLRSKFVMVVSAAAVRLLTNSSSTYILCAVVLERYIDKSIKKKKTSRVSSGRFDHT